jgi:protein SDA1
MAAPASAAPAANLVSFRDLLDFTAHVADCYPDLTRGFFGDISGILTARHAELAPDVREKIVGCLVLLHKKGLVESSMSVRLLYMLFLSLIFFSNHCFDFLCLSFDSGKKDGDSPSDGEV